MSHEHNSAAVATLAPPALLAAVFSNGTSRNLRKKYTYVNVSDAHGEVGHTHSLAEHTSDDSRSEVLGHAYSLALAHER